MAARTDQCMAAVSPDAQPRTGAHAGAALVVFLVDLDFMGSRRCMDELHRAAKQQQRLEAVAGAGGPAVLPLLLLDDPRLMSIDDADDLIFSWPSGVLGLLQLRLPAWEPQESYWRGVEAFQRMQRMQPMKWAVAFKSSGCALCR